MRQLRVASILLLSAPFAAHAQAKLQSVNLIAPTGKGRVIVPLSEQIKWQRVGLYQENSPLLEFQNTASMLTITYTLLPNDTGSGKDCRDTVMNADERRLATGPARAEIKQENKTEGTNAAGQPISSGSFLVAPNAVLKTAQENLFGIVASHITCAEIHLTKSNYTPADDASMQAVLQSMNFDADYTPTSPDYFLMGTLLGQLGQSHPGAATYYQRAVDTLPADAPIAARRAMIDRLSNAYDLSGKGDRSRPADEAGIKTDPDYPLYYYNLARADAEDFKTAEAKTHLQQAWDRKANLPAGQQMPDPTKDPTFQTLKGKSDFWAYVQTLK